MRPEDYIRWLETARDEAGAPSLDLVKATGIVYARRCGAKLRRPALSRKARLAGAVAKLNPKICPARGRQWSYAERQWVCGRCGSPWRFWERRSLRGEVQETGTRRDVAEGRLSRLVDVSMAINRLLALPRFRWESMLYVAWARGHSIRRLAELGAAGHFGAGAPFSWSFTTVRDRIAVGGREWKAILKAAHLRFDESA